MFVCPQCAKAYENLKDRTVPEICPHCNAQLRPRSTSGWTDVARIANLAEAGFLSDELRGLDIDARVFQADDFSDARGGWSTTYLIRVPAELAQDAAAHMRSYIADAAAEEEQAAHAVRFASETVPVDPTLWRPVAMVVLAGVASFVLGRQTALPDANRRQQHESLTAAIDQLGQPLYTEASPGRPRYRLSHDQPNQVWNLDLDRNGDGVYDARHQFEAAGAVW